MRLASFTSNGRATYGVAVDDETIADVGAVLGARHADVRSVVEAAAYDEVAQAAHRAPLVPLADVTFAPPLDSPRIFCIGVNYRDHRNEMGHDDVPQPTIFVRFAASLVGHGTPIERPAVSDKLDYEGELAVVIGTPGRRVPRADALDHVAGYACFNDGSVRDFQRHTSQFTAGKNFDRSGAFGPWLVTADEVPDPATLELTTRVNREVMQHATTDLLINPIPALIEYLSAFTELRPGDVIATGTPGGVGAARTPPRFLVPGDTVEVEISGVGTLVNPIVAEACA